MEGEGLRDMIRQYFTRKARWKNSP